MLSKSGREILAVGKKIDLRWLVIGVVGGRGTGRKVSSRKPRTVKHGSSLDGRLTPCWGSSRAMPCRLHFTSEELPFASLH